MISTKSTKECGEKGYPDLSKRYWYAEVVQYYPAGFLDDVRMTCDTIDELKLWAEAKREPDEDFQIGWDSKKLKEVDLRK